MRLKRPFARLPVRFCAETLAAEVRSIPAADWVAHPSNFAGNDGALLITPRGAQDQGFVGAMASTPLLDRTPYVRQIMTGLGCVWGRSRFMGLAPGAEVPPHVDTHHQWRTHWRLHIPVITNPQVSFTCGDETVHMKAGECWLFDSFRMHKVLNGGREKRVHLVLDTVGGGSLFDLLDAVDGGATQPARDTFVAPDNRTDHQPRFEKHNVRLVMSPWEMRHHIDYLLDHCQPSSRLPAVTRELDRLVDRWKGEWARWDQEPEGFPSYRALVVEARDRVFALGAADIKMDNGLPLFHCLRELVFRMAVERPEQAAAAGFRGAVAATAQ